MSVMSTIAICGNERRSVQEKGVCVCFQCNDFGKLHEVEQHGKLAILLSLCTEATDSCQKWSSMDLENFATFKLHSMWIFFYCQIYMPCTHSYCQNRYRYITASFVNVCIIFYYMYQLVAYHLCLFVQIKYV